MCSIKSVESSSLKRSSNNRFSLKLIEKRLKHLREELKTIRKRELFYTTTNLLTEQHTNTNQEHELNYKKRFHHLLNLYDKQINNLNFWHFYRSDRIEQMYIYEIRQSNEKFQTKKNESKLKLISTLNDQRRCLDIEQQNINIHSRSLLSNEQSSMNSTNNLKDTPLSEGQNHSSKESRPTYFLRRTVGNDVPGENCSTTSLNDLSIFSGTNPLLPISGGMELQCCLLNTDIEQDVFHIQNSLNHFQLFHENKSVKSINDHRSEQSLIDVRIEDGRLWYQRAWFARNSPILLVFDDFEFIPGLVLSVGRNDLLVRRSGTNIKHRISLSLLHDGHVAIRKRNCLF